MPIKHLFKDLRNDPFFPPFFPYEMTPFFPLDGSEPSVKSSQYTAPVKVNGQKVVKAIAIAANGKAGDVEQRLLNRPHAGTISTSLPVHRRFYKENAYDGLNSTFFFSEAAPRPGDHVTLTLDRASDLSTIKIVTGRKNGKDILESGNLELSTDGKTFKKVAPLQNSWAEVQNPG